MESLNLKRTMYLTEDEIRDKYKGTQLTDYAEKSYGNFVYMNVNKN